MEPVESIPEGGKKRKFPQRSNRYDADFKLQVVKKYLEESIPVSVIRQECKLSGETVGRWIRAYRRDGEAGLAPHYRGNGRSLPTPVKQKIVALKEGNPFFGIKRISQVLKRRSSFPPALKQSARSSTISLSSSPRPRSVNAISPVPVSSSDQPRTRCGRQTSSRSALAATMPI
jgi:transposase-like protein